MNYHLDADTSIAHLKGIRKVVMKVHHQCPRVKISALVYGELLFGVMNSARVKENLTHLNDFLAGVEIVDFNPFAAEIYSRVRFDLKKRGKTTPNMDMLIAATAMAHNATLVTHNTKDFTDIDGLSLEDWL